MFKLHKNKTLLITGGTGTYGKTCIEYLLNNEMFQKIIVFSRDEYKQHWLKKSLNKKYGKSAQRMRFLIGDIRDKQRLLTALKNVNYIIHAAAMKQVPACEINPEECIKTNINGTINVVECAVENNVERVLFLSTDKAVEPINLYGSCKMSAEKFTIFANLYSKKTKLACIRYGNVTGSRGSVIELFLHQKETGKFSITDKRMTRFFLQPENAVELSLFALENMYGGEIFVPNMKSCFITDIVMAVANTGEPAKANVIGIRPGEKLHEILVNQSEQYRLYKVTDKWNAILPESTPWDNFLYKYYDDTHKKYDPIEVKDKFCSLTTDRFDFNELLELVEQERIRINNE
ncbi:UDP-N-acetylglucosamine 4,6-dehydratase (inverting) [Candidatus Pacearchaeota archaeon]|nr:UDP-N-acetylglucosamine 4,6-dehydratase (inverting) [Candidatus Pacearchaeota archaeon]|tara:strand:- start:900 stop:1940 length:1041 start_codon:yes stop_codon:yes gene_type:complete